MNEKKKKNRIRISASDRTMDVIVYMITAVVIVFTLYPLIYVVSMSISDPIRAARGEVILLPKGLSILSYNKVLQDLTILRYYGNTIWYTVVGTLLGLVTTMMGAYPLTRRKFVGRKLFNTMLIVIMFFGGGMIPTYIVIVKFLHLYNTRWAMVLPSLTSAFYIFMARNFILSLPEELIESAKIDGASEFSVLGRIVVPLSKPIIAVLAMYFAVGYWNSYFPALLYQGDKSLHPLGMYVRQVVIQNSMNTTAELISTDMTAENFLSNLQLKYTVIVVAVVPLLLAYPFFGKHLKKGLMIGALKG
ncbi:MAG: carbohydrate ABC transporter permease [Lachnospiraceae bacterium]|nr:carbohydrate ABC transporter permease [Lachnospiraceae bacterium]